MKRAAIAALGMACFLLTSGVALAQTATASGDLEAAKRLIATGSFEPALKEAQGYSKANPDSFQGHYYVALAFHGLNDSKNGLAAANKALALAPDSAKPTVQKLIDRFSVSLAATTTANEADVAYDAGFNAKAARLYEEAWLKNPTDLRGATRAAKIFHTNGEFTRALILYNQVKAIAPNGPYLEEARTFLSANRETINNLVNRAIAQIVLDIDTKQFDAARTKIAYFKRMAPDRNIWVYSTNIEAALGQTDKVEVAVKTLIRARYSVDQIRSFFLQLPRAKEHFANAGIAALLNDAYGEAGFQAIKTAVDGKSAIADDCSRICPSFESLATTEFKMGSPTNSAGFQTAATLLSPFNFMVEKNIRIDKDDFFKYPQNKIQFNRNVIYSAPVSLKEYRYCVVMGACEKVAGWKDELTLGDNPEHFKQLLFTFKQATEYASWYGKITNGKYRVMSAAEWEFLCRSGRLAGNSGWLADNYKEKNKDRPENGEPFLGASPASKEMRSSNSGCWTYYATSPNNSNEFRIVKLS